MEDRWRIDGSKETKVAWEFKNCYLLRYVFAQKI
jgi:hypothetical protein